MRLNPNPHPNLHPHPLTLTGVQKQVRAAEGDARQINLVDLGAPTAPPSPSRPNSQPLL